MPQTPAPATEGLSLVKPAEAASLLGVSPRLLDTLVATGQIPVVKIGAGTLRPHRRFRRDHLDDYIRRNTSVADASLEAAAS